jgi:DNA-binding MarR family transcriptional regulator
MQASSAPAQSSSSGPSSDPAAALAEQLLALWRAVLVPRGVSTYAIFEELDLTLTQVKALTALSAGELTVKDLAERLGLSLPGASRAVDALVDRGLLDRREDPSDRRMKRLRCTDPGRDALRRLDEARLVGVAQFTATLPSAQRERLSAALAPILADLPHTSKEASP